MIYIASVNRFLDKPLIQSDRGFVHPFDGEPEVYEAETPTKVLTYLPPTENNVARYRGSFASASEAIAAIKRDFPLASIDAEY